MTNYSKGVQDEPQRIIDASTFDGTFLRLGSPLGMNVHFWEIMNNSDVFVDFSWNGLDVHFSMNTSTIKSRDITTNRVGDGGYFRAKNSQLFAKAEVGTGLVLFSIEGS